ncbi:MAG TPA: hypothetical protein VGD87_13355 [Archangium sp.]
MIIFNPLAIVVAILCGIFLGPLYWAFPDFMDTTWGDVVACSVVAVVSTVSELVGLKGRLFFLPIWLLALIGVGVNLHKLWGWYGPALALGIVVLLFGALMLMARSGEKKEWAEAPTKLSEASASLAKGLSDETWELLGAAYFVPAFGDNTPEVCRHNLQVLDLVKRAAGEQAAPLERRLFDALSVAYHAGVAPKTDGEKAIEISSELSGALQELLGNKGKLPEDEDRKDLLEELNKVGGTPAPS